METTQKESLPKWFIYFGEIIQLHCSLTHSLSLSLSLPSFYLYIYSLYNENLIKVFKLRQGWVFLYPSKYLLPYI